MNEIKNIIFIGIAFVFVFAMGVGSGYLYFNRPAIPAVDNANKRYNDSIQQSNATIAITTAGISDTQRRQQNNLREAEGLANTQRQSIAAVGTITDAVASEVAIIGERADSLAELLCEISKQRYSVEDGDGSLFIGNSGDFDITKVDRKEAL